MQEGAHRRKSISGGFRRWSVLCALATVTFFAGYIARGAADVSTPHPIRIDPTVAIDTKPAPKNELDAGSVNTGEHVFYSSPEGSVRVGVVESDSVGASSTGHFKMDWDEYVYALEGNIVIRAADGTPWPLKKGEALVLPRGFKGTATMTGRFRGEFVQVGSPSRKE